MEIIAYKRRESNMRLIPASPKREWMTNTMFANAHNCLPMRIANEAGWVVTCPGNLRFSWDGNDAPQSLDLKGAKEVGNAFGYGIVSFYLPWVFRTPHNYSLWVKGVPNVWKDGLVPLEAMVETDWNNTTFTANWKFTHPGLASFEYGEPIAMIVPVNRVMLDGWIPRIKDMPESISKSVDQWSRSRKEFHERKEGGAHQHTYKGTMKAPSLRFLEWEDQTGG